MTTPGGPQATISIDQSTLEKALVAHLFGDMLGDEASRSALLTDLVTRIIQEPERSHDKESLLQKSVKEALKERTREIAKEWMDRPETKEAIRAKVEELIAGDFIEGLLSESITLITSRLGRGY